MAQVLSSRADRRRCTAVLLAAVLLGACAPALDWRQVRPPGWSLRAALPCRPATAERTVPLAGAPLTLALSEDDGQTWPWQRNLEVGDGWCMSNNSEQRLNREYSYPSIRQSADGALHLAYTVFRQHIRHARVLPDWVKQAD